MNWRKNVEGHNSGPISGKVFFFIYLSEMSEGNEGRPGHDRWSEGKEGVFVAVNFRTSE